jgi:hypothetical protein
MIVNELKSKAMIFGKRGQQKLYFDGKELEIVEAYKYVGCIFHTVSNVRGNVFSPQYMYAQEQAKKCMFAVLRKTSNLGLHNLTPRVAMQIYDTYISPVLEYGAEIWGFGNNKETTSLEKIQLQFLKIILGVKKSTSTLALYGETGRFPIALRFKVKQAKYWARIMGLPADNIVKLAYNTLRELDACGYDNWVTNIRLMLETRNLNCHWEAQESVSNREFLSEFKTGLYDDYKTQWSAEIRNIEKHPVLRFYTRFKEEHLLEPYLFNIRDFKTRRALSQIRLSSHCLKIETGRHSKPKLPVDARICTLCDKQAIEDEVHALNDCAAYERDRQAFRAAVTRKLGYLPTLIQLLQCSDPDIIFQFGKFVTNILDKRKSAGG